MLATMQCRHEHDVVVFLQLVLFLTLELPVCFVNENKYAWSAVVILVSICIFCCDESDLHGVVENEQVFARIFHDFFTKMSNKEGYICRRARLILCRY
jgi:hypothetical protein